MGKKIRVDLADRSYDIIIGRNILGKLGSFINSQQAVIVSDPLVNRLWGNKITLENKKILRIIVPRGEKHKTIATVSKIWDKLANNRISRDAVLIALGGGVVSDLAGFAASTYMRGMRLIQAPTTLLGQVDAAIGGKTGVNHRKCKNMIGAFYQPDLVYIDTETLKTLPKKELQNGIAEVIKYGVIADHQIIELLESRDKIAPDLWPELVYQCAAIKSRVVSEDERETKGGRMILNFGHTIGHAIETLSGYGKITHGQAVGVGMVAASVIAVKQQMLDPDDLERIWNVIKKSGLPTYVKNLPPGRILTAMRLDKKIRGGKLRLVLPERIGSVKISEDVPEKVILDALEEFICK